jgi:uncharacterized protein (TIRG00374 family)
MTKSKIGQILKWVFAGLLLYWAISRGQIDWAVLGKVFRSPALFGALLLIIFLQFLASFYRWKLLLHSQQIEIPFREAIRLGMSAQFFQTLAPGTLGADVARGVYIARHAPKRKARGVSTVLLDRVMGFFGMLFLGAASFVFSLHELEASSHKMMPAIISLGMLLCAATLCIAAGLIFLPFVIRFLSNGRPGSYRDRLARIKGVHHILDISRLYSDRRDFLWIGILISVCMHVVTVGVLFTLSHILFGSIAPLSLPEFFLGASLGVLTVALPLAPSGIGVGQLAFSGIFVALGWPDASMGGSLVTAYQVMVILVNLSGFFFSHGRPKEVSS